MSGIRLEKVTVSVPTHDRERRILHETSLELTEHRVALVGPNGSGKSTIARLLNGLVRASTGRVLVEGLDVARDGRDVRRRVGFVFTDPAAQLVMPTAREDVALSLRRTHPDKAERLAAADRVLADFGLEGFGDRSVHGLSGGEGQLLALAGVLATRPSILVADEPTTLLDLGNSRRIGDLLLGLEQQVVVVTHDLDLAAQCDRVLLVRDGRVERDGDPSAVLDHYRATA
ncbi:energy-coupling factor ABC transporter ATP-binding protein [Nocardioides sp. T5]|uniref:energy-coupling factor ABC transporter ATP-binding protein n=1 Tax=Nocardioides sp. T5 TaxID=3400182 RepID=UPI003A86597A